MISKKQQTICWEKKIMVVVAGFLALVVPDFGCSSTQACYGYTVCHIRYTTCTLFNLLLILIFNERTNETQACTLLCNQFFVLFFHSFIAHFDLLVNLFSRDYCVLWYEMAIFLFDVETSCCCWIWMGFDVQTCFRAIFVRIEMHKRAFCCVHFGN